MFKPTEHPLRGEVSLEYRSAGTGRPVYGDEYFESGTNGLARYNNSGGEAVTMQHAVDTQVQIHSPNPTGHVLVFTSNPKFDKGTSPELGGFYPPNLKPFHNGCYYQRFCALLPRGYVFQLQTNSLGDGGKQWWVTSNLGTGKWEYSVAVREYGATGAIGTTGHVNVARDTSNSRDEVEILR